MVKEQGSGWGIEGWGIERWGIEGWGSASIYQQSYYLS